MAGVHHMAHRHGARYAGNTSARCGPRRNEVTTQSFASEAKGLKPTAHHGSCSKRMDARGANEKKGRRFAVGHTEKGCWRDKGDIDSLAAGTIHN